MCARFTRVVAADGMCQVLEGHLVMKPIVHEIRIQNQVIFLDPPIEYARQTWIRQLHDWLGLCNVFLLRFEADVVERYHLPATEDTEFAIRDWPPDAGWRCV